MRRAPGHGTARAASLGGMPTTVKAADAAQFLSLVPRLLGYTPARSLVVVPMAGHRSVGAMRVDLPPGDDLDTVERLASSVVGMVCRIGGAEAFVAVAYSDESAAVGLPHARLVNALGRRAEASGLAFVDALVVASDGWGSHFDPDHPEAGRPLSALETTPPLDLPAVVGDQATGAALPPHRAAERRVVGAAVQSLRTALEVLCGIPSDSARVARVDPAALEAACELDDLPRLFESALRWDAGALPPMRAALLAWCLARPALRDVALVQWATDVIGGEDALEAQRRWEDGAEYPSDLASVMWGEGPRPDPDRLETGVELARHIAALAPKRLRPGALATCAWLSWALGRSTHADRYAQLALEIEPDHGLSDIVRSFVLAGHLPDWAFRRPAGGGV